MDREGLTDFLSSEEREAGVRSYQKHSFWNGLGINFVNTSVVSLLAIHFGATNLQLGYISSVFHFTGIILVLLPRLLNGGSIQRIFFFAWFTRGLVCYFYVVLFFLEGQKAVGAIIALFTLFAMLRSIGVPMAQPIQKSLVRPSEEGSIVVRLHIRLTIAQVISQVASFLLLSIQFFNGLVGLVVLTTVGAINNTVSSWYIKGIPSRERVQYRKGQHVFALLRDTIRHGSRGLIFATRMLNVSSGILFAFGVAYLRKVVEMPTNMVFVYTIAGALAALAATYVLRPFVDTIGSRPLLIVSTMALALIAVVWAFIGADLPWVFYYLLGLVTFFFLRIRLLLLSRLIIKTMPVRDRISYSAMLEFSSAVVGLLTGLIGGALADWSESLNGPAMHIYSYTFMFAAFACVVSFLLSLKLKDPGSFTVREAAAVLLSAKNLRAYLDIYHLDIMSSPVKRESRLQSLEQSDAPIVASELKKRLMIPDTRERERILRSLAAYPRRELVHSLVVEALDEYSPNRIDAIQALGSYPAYLVGKVLQGLINDKNPRVIGASLLALARIEEPFDREIGRTLLEAPGTDAATKLDVVRAMCMSDLSGEYLHDLFVLAEPGRGSIYEQHVLSVCLDEMGFQPALALFLQEENGEPNSGFDLLIDEAKEVSMFYEHRRELRNWIEEERFDDVLRWCRTLLCNHECSDDRLEFARRAICERVPEPLTRSSALACLYIAFHISRRRE